MHKYLPPIPFPPRRIRRLDVRAGFFLNMITWQSYLSMDDMGVGDAPHQTEQSFPYSCAYEQTQSQHGMRMIRI